MNIKFFPVAQLVERNAVNIDVTRSSRVGEATLLIVLLKVGHIGGV